eukprot:NODE_684_length_5217_cov_0.512505.p2 type:complete len:411 gc:universal NODE_684_length_5217_cov_0.512505:3942-2710(-)
MGLFRIAVRWSPIIATVAYVADISRYNEKSLYDQYQWPRLMQYYITYNMSKFPPEYIKPWMYDHFVGHFILRNTLFKVFCGGESLHDLQATMIRLQQLNIGTIADYSVEQDDILIDSIQERNRQHILGDTHGEVLKQSCLGDFSAIKLSALGPTIALKRVTNLVLDLEQKYDKLTVISIFEQGKAKNYLNDEVECFEQDLNDFNRIYNRVNDVIDYASQHRTQITIDAEQTYYQPAISLISILLSKQYNIDKSVVLPTYQMYLKRGLNDLQSAIDYANKESFLFGCKIVRGAYLQSERKLAKDMNVDSPINDTIDDTHRDFNQAINVLYHYIRDNPTSTSIIASHNHDSMRIAQSLFKDHKKSAVLGQLLGMHDSLTWSMANSNYRAYKYVNCINVGTVWTTAERSAILN